MSNQQSFVGTYWFKLIIGLGLMVGGMWVSNNHLGTPEFTEQIGLPLDLGKTVAVLGVFFILFPVIEFFYLKPLQESITSRTSSLEQTFSEAESLREEMKKMKSDYERQLVQTESDARAQIQAEVKKAQDLRTQIQAEASAKADDLLRKAREEIETERDRVMNDVRVHVANLSLLATERILNENMNDERNRRLVEEFLDKAEVPKA